jgi:WD40 repeat protein
MRKIRIWCQFSLFQILRQLFALFSGLVDFAKLLIVCQVLDKQEGRILCLAWHPGGELLATGSIDTIRVWNTRTGSALPLSHLLRFLCRSLPVFCVIGYLRDEHFQKHAVSLCPSLFRLFSFASLVFLKIILVPNLAAASVLPFPSPQGVTHFPICNHFTTVQVTQRRG